MAYVNELKTLLSRNMRDYGMFIALFVIMIVFNVATDGIFLSPRNISNLINATGYIAVLAVGMTLVIVIRHIDLSVGFLAGFIGAVVAIMMVVHDISMWIAMPIGILIGTAAGTVNGFLVAKIGMPAFVVSLAGMMIFRGLLIQVTQQTGTILIRIPEFNAIGNGFIPDIASVDGRHLLTLIIGALGIALLFLSEFKARKDKIKYGFGVLSKPMFALKLAFIAVGIGYIVDILSQHNGLSWTVVIVIIVVIVYHFITTKTVLGRHIYAVGSNIEAAKLSGINVNKITFFVFASMSSLAALSGILFTSRLQSATVTAGTLFELDAIAAAYVGGVSAAGGVGKVTGSIIGALVMASLSNGMSLMMIPISWQYIVRGGVLILAVAFDIVSRNKK